MSELGLFLKMYRLQKRKYGLLSVSTQKITFF